jgi:hypothetical protein
MFIIEWNCKLNGGWGPELCRAQHEKHFNRSLTLSFTFRTIFSVFEVKRVSKFKVRAAVDYRSMKCQELNKFGSDGVLVD